MEGNVARTWRRSVAALCMAVSIVLGGCGAGAGSSSLAPAADASSAAAVSSAPTTSVVPDEDLETRLAALDGVKRVEAVDVSRSQAYVEKYVITLEQPLDWHDPTAGSFDQRVEIGIVNGASCNVFEVEGGYLVNESVATDDAHELCTMMRGNYIHAEHRFFGKSVPESLSNDGTALWSYLKAEQATADFHHIYELLSPVLAGPWIATGTGRGGMACTAYASHYPDDMAAYVAYAAPFCGQDDARLCEYIYTKTGDETYGKDKAKEYRDLVTSFQVELMSNKAKLAPALKQRAEKEGATYRDNVSAELLFDVVVLDAAVQEWERGGETTADATTDVSFAKMQKVLALPSGTDKEKQAKLDAELNLLCALSDPRAWASNAKDFPSVVSAATEYGHYRYDFKYLRDACEKAGLRDALTVDEGREPGLLYDLVLTAEQRAAFAYDAAFSQTLDTWIDKDAAHLLFVYGASDPRTALRVRATDNKGVAVYVQNTTSHEAHITDFDEATMTEIVQLVAGWVYAADAE